MTITAIASAHGLWSIPRETAFDWSSSEMKLGMAQRVRPHIQELGMAKPESSTCLSRCGKLTELCWIEVPTPLYSRAHTDLGLALLTQGVLCSSESDS